jgi:autotransporter-associated beta strand protein
LFFDLSNGTTNINDIAANTSYIGLTFNTTAGAFTLNGNAIELTGNVTSGAVTGNTETVNLGLTLDANPIGFNVTNGTLVVNGLITEATPGVSLIKMGGGNLTLTAAETYTGNTTITGGILMVNSTLLSPNVFVTGGTFMYGATSNVISGANVTISGGTYNVQNFSDSLSNLTVTGGTISGNTGSLTVANTINVNGGSINETLNGTVGLTQSGGGTTSLGAANTYTGLTTITNGNLNLNFAAAGTGLPVGNIIDDTALDMGNGNTAATLSITGNNSTANVQSFSSLTLFTGANHITLSPGVGGTTNLTIAGVPTTSVGATLQFSSTGLATLPAVTSSPLLVDTHGNAYAIFGNSDWAATDANGNVVAATYTAIPASGSLVNGVNNDITGNATGSGNNPSSVRFANSAGPYSLTLTGVNQVGGILVGNTSVGAYINGPGSVEPYNLLSGSSASSLPVYQNSAQGNLTIGAIVADNGSASTTLVKSGPGRVILSGTNTYTGGTDLNEGTVSITNNANLGSATSSVYVQGGTLQALGNLTLDNGSGVVRNIVTNGTAGLDVTPGYTLTIDGVISGVGSISKTGLGTLSMNNTNTYTGTTGVNAGTLVLDFTGAHSPTSNIVSPSSMLSLGGGTLLVNGSATTANTQTFANTTLNAGNDIVSAAPVSGSNLPTVNLGALNVGLGATIEFIGAATVTGATGTLVPATANITTTTAGLGGAAQPWGILAGPGNPAAGQPPANADYATVGLYDWASTNTAGGGGGTSPYTILGGSQVSGFYTTVYGNTNTNFDLTSGSPLAMGSGNQVNQSVRFNTAGQTTITLANSTNFNVGGFLITPNMVAANTFVSEASGATTGQWQIDRSGSNGAQEGVIWQNNVLGFFEMTVPIVDGRQGVSSASSIVKAGAGTVLFTSTGSTYTGQTYVNGGNLEIIADTNIGSPSAASALNLNGGTLVANANFTLDNGGVNPRPIVLLGNGGGITADQTVIGGSNTVTVDGVISGTGMLNIGFTGNVAGTSIGTANTIAQHGNGTVKLTGTNTYTGGTSVNGGTLAFSTGSLGTGGITVSNATLLWNTGTTQDISTQVLTFGTNGTTMNTNGNNVTLANPIGNNGPGNLTKAGLGALMLAAANNYTNSTIINNGTLLVTNTSGSATGSGAVTVNSTLATLGGTGIISGPVTMVAGSNMTPGLSSTVGSLTVGGLTLNAPSGTINATLNFYFGTSTNSEVLDTSNLVLNGGAFKFFQSGTVNPLLQPGVYDLIQYTGTLSGTYSGNLAFSVLNPAAGFHYVFSDTGSTNGFLVVTVTGTFANGTWIASGSGNWNNSANWANSVIPNAVGQLALLGTNIHSNTVITVDGQETLGGFDFNNPTNTYTVAALTGNAITLDNSSVPAAANLTVTQGNDTISAPLIIANGLGLTANVGAGFSLTLSGNISETGGAGASFVNNGAGSITLSGTNTYTGTTVLNAGTLQFFTQSNLGTTGNLDINGGTLQWGTGAIADISANGALVTVDVNGATLDTNGNNVTIANPIGNNGTGQLTKAGSGILTLSAVNTYTGGTDITGGEINFSANTAFGPNPNITFDGGGIQWANGSNIDISATNNLIFNSTGVLDTNGNNVTLATPIGGNGTGGFTKTGNGILILTANNTYLGTTGINGGTLEIGNTAELSLPSSGGGLSFNGGALLMTANVALYNGAEGTNDRPVSFGSGNGSIDVPANTTLTISGIISGSGRLTKVDNGTITILSPIQNQNTGFTGGTLISSGTILLGDPLAASNGLGTGPIILDGGTLNMRWSASTSPQGGFLTAPLVVDTGFTGTIITSPRQDVASPLTGNGTLVVQTDYVRSNFDGNWSQFTGQINIIPNTNGGDFRINNTAGFPNASVNLATGTDMYMVLTPPGAGFFIGALSGNGDLSSSQSTATTAVYDIGGLNTNTTFSGLIFDQTGPTAITKVGNGTLTLTDTETNTGPTVISNGTLQIGNNSATGSLGTGTITDNGTLMFSRSDSTANVTNIISGIGGVTGNGSGTVTLSGANTYTGVTTFEEGTLSVASLPNGGVIGPLGNSTSNPANFVFNGGSLQYTGPTDSTDRSFTVQAGGATLDASGTGVLTFSNTTAVTFGSASPATITFTGNNTGLNTFAGGIGDNGGNPTSVTMNGTGLWDLTNTNTYTGNTTVNSGTLEATSLGSTEVTINGGSLTNSSVGGDVTVNSTGTLAGSTVTGNVAINSGGTMSGASHIGGALTASGNVTATGTVGGLVTLGSGAVLQPGGNSIGNLTVGSLTLLSNSNLNFIFSNITSYDQVDVLGNLTLNTGINLSLFNTGLTPFTGTGNFDIILFGGAFSGDPTADITIANPQAGLSYTFGVPTASDSVRLIIGSAGLDNSWNLTVGGSWGNGTAWSNGFVPPANATVHFFVGGTGLTQNASITLDGNRSAGGVQFSNSVYSYSIDQGSGGNLILNNGANATEIDVFQGNHSITAPVILTAGGLATNISAGDILTISGVIGQNATAAVTNIGSGNVILSGLNTYTGVTTITAGTVAVTTLANGGSPSSLGESSNAASNLVINGGTLRYIGAGSSTDRLFSLGSSGGRISASGTGPVNFTNPGFIGFTTPDVPVTLTLSGSNTGSNTLASALNDNGLGALSVVKSGTGFWLLSGSNTQSGVTTISGGTLQIGSIANGSISQSSSTFGPAAEPSCQTTASSTNIFIGDTSALTANMTVTGPGIPANDTIATVNGDGSIDLVTPANSTATVALNFSGVPLITVSDSTQFQPGESVTGVGIPTGSTILSVDNTMDTVTISQNATATNAASSLNFFTANPLGGSSNAASNLVIDGGTLQYVGPAASTDRLFTIGVNGTTLDASGTGPINFTNSGSLGFVGTTSTSLTLTGNNTGNNTLAATITDSSPGLTSVIKSGPGVWALTGVNTYSGVTNITAGTLQINSSTSLGNTSNVTIGNATLEGQATFTLARNIVLGSPNSTVLVDDGQALTIGSNISGTGTLNFSGNTGPLGSTLTLSGTGDTYSGGTIVNGTLAITTNTALGTGGVTLLNNSNLTVNPAPQSLTNNITIPAGDTGNLSFVNAASTSYSGIVTGNATSVLNLNVTSNPLSPNGNATTQFGNFDGNINITLVGNGSVRLFAVTNFANATINLESNTGGAFYTRTSNTVSIGALTGVAGSILNSASTDSGTTIWQIGSLNTNDEFDGNIFQTDNGNTSIESLNKVGTGILTLTGTNLYSGNTTFTGGEIDFANITNIGNGTLSFNGGALQWATSTNTDISNRPVYFNTGGGNFDTNGNTITLAGTIGDNGPGGFTVSGGGELELGGAGVYNGSTTISSGTLEMLVGNAIAPNSTVNISNAGELEVNGQAGVIGGLNGTGTVDLGSGSLTMGQNNASTTYSGTIMGESDGGITKTGTGQLTLGGTLSYSGPTMISGGNLVLDSNLPNSSVTVAAGGILVSGPSLVITNNVTLLGGGRIYMGGSGSNVLTVGTLTWNTNGTAGILMNLSNTSSTSDSINITGNLIGGTNSQGGAGQFVFDFQHTGFFGGVYTLLDFPDGGSSGLSSSDFSAVNILHNYGGIFDLNNATGELTFTINAIPEPSTVALLMGGAVMLLGLRRKRAGK